MASINNLSALSFVQQHGKVTPALNKSIQKIATGLRIPNAAADPAGLAVSKMLEAEDVSFQQALRNTNDGVSMVQTAEGTLDQGGQLLTRMKELSVQASNGTYSNEDRAIMDQEFQQLSQEFDRISGNANFNGVDLLNGGQDVSFQVGGDADPSNQISMNMGALQTDSTTLGFNGASIATAGGAQSAMSSLDSAIEGMSERRAELGATQNRLSSSYDNVTNYSENLVAANSRISDLDYALESSVNSQFILRQKALMAAQAQAQKMAPSALSLLN